MSPCRIALTWLSVCCLVIATSSSKVSTPQLSRVESYAQRQLMPKSDILVKTAKKNHPSNDVEVAESFRWKLGISEGTAAASFRSFGQSFLLSDQRLFLIKLNAGSAPQLQEMLKINSESKVLFIESVEWRKTLFLLIAFENGIMELFRVADDMAHSQHKVSCCDEPSTCVPKAAEFFIQDGELYLVLISDSPGASPVILYQWKTADWDRLDTVNKQLDREQLTSPTALATFPSKSGTVIVVARMNKLTSKNELTIYTIKRRTLKLVQIVEVDGVVAILPFLFENRQHLLVLTPDPPCFLYAWDGKQLISRTLVSDIPKARVASVSYVNGATFLMLSERNYVHVFLVKGLSLIKAKTVELSGLVQSANIHASNDGVFLIAISSGNSGLTPYIIKLQIGRTMKPTEKVAPSPDELSKLLADLNSFLAARSNTLTKLVLDRSKLLSKHHKGRFSGKFVVNSPHKVYLRKGTQASILMTPRDYNLTATPSQVKEEIALRLRTAEGVIASLPGLAKKSESLTWVTRDQQPLKLASLKAKKAFIEDSMVDSLNNRLFAPENILKYSRNQTFTGKISARDVTIDKAVVETLTGMNVGDLLLDSGVEQTVAFTEVPSVTAGSVNVVSGKINNIPLNQVVKNSISKDTIIRGHKTAPSLDVENLEVIEYNKVDLAGWWNKIRPDLGNEARRPTHIQSDLIVKNLTVTNVNGFPLNKLVASLFQRGKNQEIRGTLEFKKKPKFTNLSTEKILGKPSSNLMTSSTDQSFDGVVSFGALRAPKIVTNYVNKLNLSSDVARLDSPHVFSGYAAFGEVIVDELTLPLNTFVNGSRLPPHFLQEQRQEYKQPVRIRGTLHVADLNLQGSFAVQGQPLSFSALPSMFWTKKTPQTIPVPVSAEYPLQVKSLSATNVNGVEPRNILHCDTLEVLSVPWVVPSAVVIGNVEHLPGSRQPLLNPLSLSRSVVKTEGNFTVKGKKDFTAGIEIGHLYANRVDDKDPNNALRLGDSVIPGSNTWDRIHIEKDLVIEADLNPAKVNNENLCKKIEKAVRTNEPAHLSAILMNTLVAGNMSLGVLNSVPVGERSRRSINPQLRRLMVTGTVRVPAIEYIETVNLKKWRNVIPYVVNKKIGAYISGRKTFSPAQVVVHNSFYASTVNNVELNEFIEKLLSRTKPQIVTARYTVASAEASSVVAYDINGIDVRKLLTVNSDLRIDGNLRFSGGLRIRDLTTDTLINRKCRVEKIKESLSSLESSPEGDRYVSLKIDGDLTWESARKPTSLADRGLSYLLDSAVTVNGDHVILGATTFGGPVSVAHLKLEKHINDIALESILSDSLKKNSPVDQVIRAHIRFANDVKASSLEVTGNIDVATVNRIKIADLDKKIVRKSRNTGTIRGLKAFKNGVVASVFVSDGGFLVLQGKLFAVSNIVTSNMARLPHLVLNTRMRVFHGLNFTRFNDFDIKQLLEERVTLDTPQNISATITFVDGAVNQDEAVVSNINNVGVSTVVTTDDPRPQIIFGPKTFTRDIVVEGSMELGYLNSLNFTTSIFEALLKDLPATIVGSVTFANELKVDADLTVGGTVNGITLADLQLRLNKKTLKYPKAAQDRLAMELRLGNGLLAARRNPEECLYLESVPNLDIRVSNMTRAVAIPYNGHIRLDVYGADFERQCGLPEGCACPVLMTLELEERDGKLVRGNWQKEKRRTFTFQVEDSIVEVLTDSTSRDTRCRVSPDAIQSELTYVSWYRPGESRPAVTSPGFRGYVSDAAVVPYGGFIYVVVGLSYDALYDSTNMRSLILRIDPSTNTISLTDAIITYGVSAINAFTVASVPYLVIGNSYDSGNHTTQVPLEIYRFNTGTYKFEAIKTVTTKGVIAIASLVHGPNAVIVVAQAQTNAPVLVFQYDSLYNTFNVIQQLTNTALPTGLGAFRVSDGFIGLSTADDKFRLYKFCDIQGLKLFQEYRSIGVQGFARFDFSKHYLFLTSSQESSLLELVVQGL